MGQASPNKRTNAKTNTSSTPVYGAHPMLSSLQYQQFPTGIWVKGRGSEGQLCNGKTQHVSISQPIENLPNLLQNQQIFQVVGECWHLVILTTAGLCIVNIFILFRTSMYFTFTRTNNFQVFAAGWNDYGQVRCCKHCNILRRLDTSQKHLQIRPSNGLLGLLQIFCY